MYSRQNPDIVASHPARKYNSSSQAVRAVLGLVLQLLRPISWMSDGFPQQLGPSGVTSVVVRAGPMLLIKANTQINHFDHRSRKSARATAAPVLEATSMPKCDVWDRYQAVPPVAYSADRIWKAGPDHRFWEHNLDLPHQRKSHLTFADD